ncbi:hypothetical protein BDV06DRAFT_61965 [Aspergillus oleicola]
MLVTTSLVSDGLHDMRHRDHSYNYNYNFNFDNVNHHSRNQHQPGYKIIKQHQGRKTWKMEDNKARRQRYTAASPYTTATMDSPSPSLVYPDDSMLYASSAPFAPLPSSHPVQVPEDYLSYGSQLDPTGSYYPAPTQPHQPSYIPHSNTYYLATTPSQQWLHPSHASPAHSHHGHGHGHTHAGHYQDSIPSSDLDPDFDVDIDMDIDLEADTNPNIHLSPSSSISGTTSTLPSRTPSSTSASHQHKNANTKQDTKDLTLYGTPSPTHPGTWRCAYPSCTSPSLFRRGCDLRKHYNRHRKHLFCRHDRCPQSDPSVPGAGFSSKKDRDRHEAKHNPGIRCELADHGCGRVFSRVDNMKDHVRRIHKGV